MFLSSNNQGRDMGSYNFVFQPHPLLISARHQFKDLLRREIFVACDMRTINLLRIVYTTSDLQLTES